MTRRPVLPGASELFRRTDTPSTEADVTELPSLSATAASPALRGSAPGRRSGDDDAPALPLTLVPGGAADLSDQLAAFRSPAPVAKPSIPTRGRPARGSERPKHDEKITVYISADELVALESARLMLRAQHGVAADRGRIVREAVAVLLADFSENGDNSVLVQRLKGR